MSYPSLEGRQTFDVRPLFHTKTCVIIIVTCYIQNALENKLCDASCLPSKSKAIMVTLKHQILGPIF